jgi:hypothetical protein
MEKLGRSRDLRRAGQIGSVGGNAEGRRESAGLGRSAQPQREMRNGHSRRDCVASDLAAIFSVDR